MPISTPTPPDAAHNQPVPASGGAPSQALASRGRPNASLLVPAPPIPAAIGQGHDLMSAPANQQPSRVAHARQVQVGPMGPQYFMLEPGAAAVDTGRTRPRENTSGQEGPASVRRAPGEIEMKAGNELESLTNALRQDPNLDFTVQYLDEAGERTVALDQGGLTREALTKAIRQLSHNVESKDAFTPKGATGLILTCFDPEDGNAAQKLGAWDQLGLLMIALCNENISLGRQFSAQFYSSLEAVLGELTVYGGVERMVCEFPMPLTAATQFIGKEYADATIQTLGTMLQKFDSKIKLEHILALTPAQVLEQVSSLFTPYIVTLNALFQSKELCVEFLDPQSRAQGLEQLRGVTDIKATTLKALSFAGNQAMASLCRTHVTKYIQESSEAQVGHFLTLMTGAPEIHPSHKLKIAILAAKDMPVVYVGDEALPVNQHVSTCGSSMFLNEQIFHSGIGGSYEAFMAVMIPPEETGFNTA